MARKRFIASILKTAAKPALDMPWTRGISRKAHIEARKAPTQRRARA